MSDAVLRHSVDIILAPRSQCLVEQYKGGEEFSLHGAVYSATFSNWEIRFRLEHLPALKKLVALMEEQQALEAIRKARENGKELPDAR